MSIQDVGFLQSKARFPPHKQKNCGRDESLGTTTRHRTLVGGK